LKTEKGGDTKLFMALPGPGPNAKGSFVNRTNGVQETLKFKVIFSLGPACGCIITLSSYNRYYTKAIEKSIFCCSRQKKFAYFSIFSLFFVIMNHPLFDAIKKIKNITPYM
jgi:hypothetical protein